MESRESKIRKRLRAADAPRLVSVAQAAEAMGLSRRRFYARTGHPFMRHSPRGWRVDLAALVIPAVELYLVEIAERAG